MSDADPIAFAQALIRCPSVTPDEGGALAFLACVLERAGYEVHLPVFSTPGTADVQNLFARIGSGAPCFAFAGHTDVVPPGDAGAWTHPPFAAEIEDGELYGRGAVDMKGGVAAFLAAALRFGKPATGSIAFVITGDEEGPSINGTDALLRWATERGERFDHCLVGEPTNPRQLGDAMKIGRRGGLSGTITVIGKQGHSAYPQLAENPIPGMLRLLTGLLPPLDTGNARFEPSNLEIVSIDVGNPAFNVIPGEARARFNVRFNDCYTADSLKAEIERRLEAVAAGKVRYELVYGPRVSHCFLTKPGPFVDLVAGVVEDATGRRPALTTNGGTSDARFFKDYCPVIEFGLVGQTMHQIDERVRVDDLYSLAATYEQILRRYFATFGPAAASGG